MKSTSPIIVALDVPDAAKAIRIALAVRPHVGAVKVGKELFVAEGPGLVRELRERDIPVFLDLKFHDIPNTVAKAVASATRLGVQMLTVHASGGRAMLEVARRSAVETAESMGVEPPLVLAVTVLTSMDEPALREVGVAGSVEHQVERLARLAVVAGIRGLVCSPLELSMLRSFLPSEMALVTPGIRTGGEKADDQKRTLGPREAMTSGANWLVIGRPIYAAADPEAAADVILRSIRA